jgi:uncharacterized RDD family membrane protein YckC
VESTAARNAPTTPQPNASAEDELATRSTRLIAAILDGMLLFPFLLAPHLLRLVNGGSLSPLGFEGASTLAMFPMTAYQWWLITRTGQTLGKRWMNIRVVKLDGSPVDFFSGVLLRNAIIDVTVLILAGLGLLELNSLFSALNLLWIFGAQRRCLHDHLAGTKVVVAS